MKNTITCVFCKLEFSLAGKMWCQSSVAAEQCEHSPPVVSLLEVMGLRPGDTVTAIVAMPQRQTQQIQKDGLVKTVETTRMVPTEITGEVIGAALTGELNVMVRHVGKDMTRWINHRHIRTIERTAPEGAEPRILSRAGDAAYSVPATPEMTYTRKLLVMVVAEHGRDVASRLLHREIGVDHIKYLTPGMAPTLRAWCEELLQRTPAELAKLRTDYRLYE